MKKLFTILAILIAFSASAFAQLPSSPISLYAGGALSIPTAPESFSETFKNGFHGMVGVGYSVSPMIEMVGKIEYHSFKFDFDNGLMDGYSGGTNNMWMYGADAKVAPSLPALPVKPYGLLGVGFATIKQTEFDGPTSLQLSALNSFLPASQTEMYWNIGAGFNLATSPALSLFAQARYVSIQTEGEAATFIPVTVGLKFF